ncbi:MAG: hypothetical protein M3R02_23395 [Chloroflexota bacterium]|nr:hypothetical protein [Chloroflexota bacterium]
MDFNIQDEIRRARAAGLSDSEIEYFLELTAGERERIEAGDLSAWVGKDSPDYRRRLHARARAGRQAKTRQWQEAKAQAEAAMRLQALMERPGITEAMTIEDAIVAGIITEAEVDAAVGDPAVERAIQAVVEGVLREKGYRPEPGRPGTWEKAPGSPPEN